jgi:hypothetical protein
MSTVHLRAPVGEDEGDDVDPATLGCPIDVSCLWRAPAWALSAWLTTAAGLVGVTPSAEGDNSVGRRPRYIPLAHGDTGAALSVSSADDESAAAALAAAAARGPSAESGRARRGGHRGADANAGTSCFEGSPAQLALAAGGGAAAAGARPSGASRGGGGSGGAGDDDALQESVEFEVWRKYIRDLSNFAAVDVDVSIVRASSDDRSGAAHLLISVRGPLIPSLGRCRRALDGTAFIAPTTPAEWRDANPIRAMEVIEVFLLAVAAPDVVADDDAVQVIIEHGTRFLAIPDSELGSFLRTVADWVRVRCCGVKLVVRDIDFTAEFETARNSHADRFLVLDTSNPSFPRARESAVRSDGAGGAASGGAFVLLRGVLAGIGGGGDAGSCPAEARDLFEADYSMLDVVRAVRTFVRRIVASVAQLRTIEVLGCNLRDSDLDVGGIFAARQAVLAPAAASASAGAAGASAAGGFESGSGAAGGGDDDGDDDERREAAAGGFPAPRVGAIVQGVRRASGPSRLVLEHCGLGDAHVAALVRLLRVEAERARRDGGGGGGSASASAARPGSTSVVVPFIAALESLRIAGQIMPLLLIGLLMAMQDAWDDGKATWTARGGSAEAAAGMRLPLRLVEVPSSVVHELRSAVESRGVSSAIVCRSID